MTTPYEAVRRELGREPRRWLITGVAGFIGSNLLEALLELGQSVVGLDNFSLGRRQNLEEVRAAVGPLAWARFRLLEADVRARAACQEACRGVDVVLHQAAIGSVPRSLEDPLATHDSNVTGHLNILLAARDASVKRFVYASSSSVYGDSPALPKREGEIGRALSPYAASKQVDELYTDVVARVWALPTVGLRYFNVFGPRQDPEGAYAAVIPAWIAAMMAGAPVYINGDGETSRDFCYVQNVVQLNLLAACTQDPAALNQVYNAATGSRTSLNELFELLRARLRAAYPGLENLRPVYRDFRAGDVMHSQADIGQAQRRLGYRPSHTLEQGLDAALGWYTRSLAR